MGFRLITDSTCDLPSEIIDHLDIVVVPCTVRFGDMVYQDGVDLSRTNFYSLLSEEPAPPTTAQPPIGAFVEAYQRLGESTDEILSLHISSKLSATCHSANLAKGQLEGGARIEVVDSLQVSLGLGILAREVGRMAQQGASLNDALEFVSAEIPNVSSYCTVDTLDYLVRGGRASRLQGLFGSLLDVKPIIVVKDDGETHSMGRARTKRKAAARLAKIVADQAGLAALGVLHSAAPEEAVALADSCSEYFPRDQMIISEFSAVMGAHLGPKALGLGMWVNR